MFKAAAHKRALAERLSEQFERLRRVRAARGLEQGLSPEQRRLSEWQSARLRATYADLMAEPRFAPATRFFLDDLYGPHDFSRRDRELERIFPLIMRVVPPAVMHTLTAAVELHALTLELDGALVEALRGRLGRDGAITAQAYAAAYRACDNRAARQRQLLMVLEVGRDLDRVVKSALVYGALRMAHGPAHVAGLGELQDFLERGFGAFRHMGGADPFLETIRDRETRIMERLFAGEPQPFDLEPGLQPGASSSSM